MEISFLILILIAAVAFFYASVGHGGASGYLAVMALLGFAPETMKVSALMLNIFVAGIAFYNYYNKGSFKWKLFFAFAGFSIPFAFLGSFVSVDASVYKLILGFCLLLAAIRIIGFGNNGLIRVKSLPYPVCFAIGAGIGFISGMIGIGGGIILSPILLLLFIANMKETAAISALFIVVNSISGFSGALLSGQMVSIEIIYLLMAALMGGTIGAFMGSHRFNFSLLKYVLSGVLIIAGFKLFF